MVSLKVLHVYIQSPLSPPSPCPQSLLLEEEGKKKSPKIFTWNHELLERIASYLKDVAIQTSPPVIQSPGFHEQAHLPATPTSSYSHHPNPPSLLRNSLTLHRFSSVNGLMTNINLSEQFPHLFVPRLRTLQTQAGPGHPHPNSNNMYIYSQSYFFQTVFLPNTLAHSIIIILSLRPLTNIFWTPHPSVPKSQAITLFP